MSNWREVKIGDLGKVVTGKTPPSSSPDYFGSEMPFLTPTDMDGSRRVLYPQRRLSKQAAEKFRSLVVSKGVAVSCIGWQMGKAILIDEPSLTNQQINTIIVDESKFNRLFLFYAMRHKREEFFRLGSGGSRTPILKKSAFEKVTLRLPDRETQEAIANILGALDDKIEVDQQMNKTLEAMAQAIFRSWFVDVDPVVAKAAGRHPFGMDAETAACFPDRFAETAAGTVPMGWRFGKIDEIVSLERESLNPQAFPDEFFFHYSIPAFDEYWRPKLELGAEIGSNKFVLTKDVVLLSKLNPHFPRIWLPSLSEAHRSISSTEFLVTVPKSEYSRQYAYSLFSSDSFIDVFGTLVTGTSGSHQRVKPDDFLKMDIVIPSQPLVDRYTQLSKPLFKNGAIKAAESEVLACLRDSLLPKLLSGEIRVKQAEQVVQEAV